MMPVLFVSTTAARGRGFHRLFHRATMAASASLLHFVSRTIRVIVLTALRRFGFWHIGLFHHKGKRTTSRIITLICSESDFTAR
jgi:hypothetical protein